MNLCFTLEFHSCLDLSIVHAPIDLKSCSSEICNVSVQFQIKIQKIVVVLQNTQNLVISRCFCAEKSKLRPFQTKTELFCSGYGCRAHYNAENDHRKRSHSNTLSRVERFENDAFWKHCFLVWTEKTMLSDNGDVIKVDTTRRQTSRP